MRIHVLAYIYLKKIDFKHLNKELLFFQMAYHPAETTSDVTVTWSVAGMRCEPSALYAEKIIEEDTVIFTNISKLKNVGGSAMSSVESEVKCCSFRCTKEESA